MLTVTEEIALKYIINFKQTNGYSPTLKEIGRGINTKSNRQVHEIMSTLRAKEYINFLDKKPRTIRVLKFN